MEEANAGDTTVVAETHPVATEPRTRRRRWPWIGVVLVGAAAATWFAYDRLRPVEPLSAAEEWVRLRVWERAEAVARRYARHHPHDPDAVLVLARALAAQERFSECAEALEAIPGDAGYRCEGKFRAGQAWILAKRPRRAEAAWLAALQLEPGDIDVDFYQQEARRELCGLYAVERRDVDVRAMIWQFYLHSPPKLGHEALAMAVRLQLEVVEARAALDLLLPRLANDPLDHPTRRAIAMYQIDANQLKQAEANLVECLKALPKDPMTWEAWLRCLFTQADFRRLEAAVASMPAEADVSPECLKFRAIVAEEKGEFDRAITYLRRASEILPSKSEYQHRLGELLQRTKQLELAKAARERSQQLTKSHQELQDAQREYRLDWERAPEKQAQIAYRLGTICERIAMPREAVGWYRAALSAHPTHPPSIAALERLRPPPIASRS